MKSREPLEPVVWSREFVKEALKDFEPIIKKTGNISPCMIRINGKFVRTKSGKSLWKRTSDAKNAVRNHLQYDLRPLIRKNFNLGEKEYLQNDRLLDAFLKYLYDSGTIEIVPVDEVKHGL